MISQLADALLFCHEKKVVHRDVKLQNVLVDHNYHIKLIDFGLSAVCNKVEEMEKLDRLCGSPFYVPPELYDGHYDGTKTDVWSLGILLYVLTAKKFPYDNKERDLLKLANSVKRDPFEMPICSDELKDVLRRMLEKNPAKRVSLEELKRHPWFSQKQKRGTPDIGRVSEKISKMDFKHRSNIHLSAQHTYQFATTNVPPTSIY